MSNLITDFRYRPEIDGLRAIAVLAVVFFHAGFGITGGYVGVDVFFVISGYLITSLIIKEIENGTFTLANFWERRARRLIPAMVVVVVATLFAGWFLLLPIDYANLGRSAAWQAVFGANFHFWSSTSYFSSSSEELPLLHTWSLAVEEQYYAIVPLLFIILFRITWFRNYKILLFLFTFGIFLSLAASVYGVRQHPTATFYLLPTRAWEMLLGAFVALVPMQWIPKSRPLREMLSILGILGILVPCWLYTKATPFPGVAALIPCAGTALLIWIAKNDGHNDARYIPIVARFLSFPPIVFIGLISYSLYLWHWPLIAFTNYLSIAPKNSIDSLMIVLVSFILSVLTWRYVETPFRKRVVGGKRTMMFLYTAAGLTLIFVLGAVITLGNGHPSRFSTQAIEFANAKDDMLGIHDLVASDVKAGKLINLGTSDNSADVKLLLWGDSHAMAAAPAFDRILEKSGLRGLQATASATPPVLGAYWHNDFANKEAVTAFNSAVFEYVKRERISDVVLVGYWEYYTDEKGKIPLNDSLVATVKKLNEAGVRPWIMLQIPHPDFDVPRALAFSKIFDFVLTDLPGEKVRPEWNGIDEGGRDFVKKIEAAGGHILDPRSCFIDKSNSLLLLEKNGKSLFRDAHHLSASGAKMVLAPCLSDMFDLNAILVDSVEGHNRNAN